jgi:replicative DNA helicase
MTTLSSLTKYGADFQGKVIGSLLINKDFLLNTIDLIDDEYFETQTNKWIIKYIRDYFHEYHTHPTLSILVTEIKKIDNDVLVVALKNQVEKCYKYVEESKDIKWVQKEFKDFCKNQRLKKALMTSVDLLNLGDFDGIRDLINNASQDDIDRNVGHLYSKDVESRYRETDRNVIPFPWKTFNDITGGGVGGGDLVIIFGNPKGGKSWAVAAMGAHAAKLGKNVLIYSLELGEGYLAKRYDSIITGIPLDELNNNKEKVAEMVGNLKGKIVIKEYPPKTATMATLESHMNELEIVEDFIPDMIIIDYLDYIKSSKKGLDAKGDIDDVYISGKALAKKRNVPVISPSQANRTGAGEQILESQHAAGSYDKVMIADMLFSLARGKKDRLNGTGKWHVMGNRYGPDGLTFNSTIDTSCGLIDISETPLDEDFESAPKQGKFDEDEKGSLNDKWKKFSQS